MCDLLHADWEALQTKFTFILNVCYIYVCHSNFDIYIFDACLQYSTLCQNRHYELYYGYMIWTNSVEK